MQEIVTPNTVAAILAADMLRKLLGPTAAYLGEDMKGLVERKRENIARVFSNAKNKLGPRLNSPGTVPPRVLKAVVNEGAYTEDSVAAEYLGGVLASSKTEMSRDDRGTRLIRIVENLSTYQIRTHYLIYSTIAHVFSGSEINMGLASARKQMTTFIPLEAYAGAMEFNQHELSVRQLQPHIWGGLASEDLIEKKWLYGTKDQLKKFGKDTPGAGVIWCPSALGTELFLWAFGHGDKSLDYLLADNLETQIPDLTKHLSGSIALEPA